MPKIVLSRTRIGFVLGSGYKYQTLAIVKNNQSIKYKSITFFGSSHPLGVGVE